MKVYLMIFIILIIGEGISFGQTIPVETMVGTENYWYQHNLSRRFSANSKFGFMHVSSIHAFYNKHKRDEIMSQSYLAYAFAGSLQLAAGTFYATGPGFSPSAGIVFFKQEKDLVIVINPRLDLKENPSYDLMAMVQFRPRLTQKIRLYSKFQMMSNYTGDDHNRSYQNFRLGLEIKNFQGGIGLNLDEYGKHFKTYYNPGLFVRAEI